MLQDDPAFGMNVETLPGPLVVRGLFSAKVPNSSFAEVRMGLLIEPAHMENEDEDQVNEKEKERL